ncbi:putative membrane protein [Frondihabitans sp. 762G35]|uniref:DedA family protein n=1 Tax=Frondihabitans sp. 762G35 TaxID=1446794 RepID=UPI000D210055|nr:VTT domain-containing protein [Frondihabitans sp. 762G35]ARC57979.1 putative membrane protein [Frondihabitans sp. 762G35]
MTTLAAAFSISSLLDPSTLLTGAGPWVLGVIALFVFIESGVLFPFLPGDSLLFTAALLAGRLGLPIWLIIVVAAAAAIAGDQVGYFLGNRFGRRLFRDDARVLKTKHLDRADAFFVRYGPRALVLARFVPVVRTYVPPIVGMSKLPYRKFLVWNVIGAVAWVLVAVLAGYFLGGIPFVANHVDIIAIAIVVVSLVPIVVEVLVSRRREAASPDGDASGTDVSESARRS